MSYKHHLFYIELETVDGIEAWLASGLSDSELKAQELAEAAAIDDAPVGAALSHSQRLCASDVDVFQKIGVLASH